MSEKNLVVGRITSIAFGGNGVSRINGKVCFVPFTAPGDLVEIRVVKEKGNYLEGSLERILEESPFRREPECELFGACGGCSLQHLQYKKQTEEKEQILKETLKRIGKISCPVTPIIPSPKEYGYRIRTQLKHSSTGILGYYRQGSRILVPVKRCPVLAEPINQYLETILFQHPSLPQKQRDLELSLEDSGEVTARWLYKSKNTNPFSQINREVNDSLRKAIKVKLKEYFSNPGTGIDLFCGDGNLSLPLAEEGWSFRGLETSAEAIERGRKKIFNRSKIDYLFQRIDLYSDVGRLQEVLKKQELLIADPPRGGLQGLIYPILQSKPRVIFYISCNPPILAKEINLLSSGYTLREVIPLDMFPQTHHLETLAILLAPSKD